MATHVPKSALDPAKTYTIEEFLDIPNHLNDSETEIVLMRIVSLNLTRNHKVALHKNTATGAEFLQEMEAAQRVVHVIRTRGIVMHVPGGPTVTLTEPLEPLVTDLVKLSRKR